MNATLRTTDTYGRTLPTVHAPNLGDAGLPDSTPDQLLTRTVARIQAKGAFVVGVVTDGWSAGMGQPEHRRWTIDVAATEDGETMGAVEIRETRGHREERRHGRMTSVPFHSAGINFAGPVGATTASEAVRALLGAPARGER